MDNYNSYFREDCNFLPNNIGIFLLKQQRHELKRHLAGAVMDKD